MNRKLSKVLASAVVAASLVGCASAPEVRPIAGLDSTVEIPERWQTQSLTGDRGDRDWWRALEDPRVDVVVEEALRQNHTLGLAIANVEAAHANATIAGAGRWPQINGTLRSSRSKQIFVGLPFPGAGPASSLSNVYTPSLDASWELDLWNRLGQQAQAAVAQWQASEAELRAARLSIAAQSVRAWASLIESRSLRELSARSVDTYRETARISRSRYDRGLTNAVDVHLASTQLESAAALLEERDLLLQQNRRQLELLLGRYPRGAFEEQGELPVLAAAPPAGLPADLLRRRPDLVAAERRLAASGALTRAAQRELLPRITLTGSTGTTSDQLSDLLDGKFSIWSLAGGLVQPLFQGGRLRAQVAVQRASQRASLEQYATAVLAAFAEVENSLDAESRLVRREIHLRAAFVSAERAATLSEDRYRRGIGDLLQVLEAQRRALDSESLLVSIEAQRLRQRVDLHVALGGDFDPNDRAAAQTSSVRHTAPSSASTR
jgi:outer membrane protein, multidrug efflux system